MFITRSTDPVERSLHPFRHANSHQQQMTALKTSLFLLLVALCMPSRYEIFMAALCGGVSHQCSCQGSAAPAAYAASVGSWSWALCLLAQLELPCRPVIASFALPCEPSCCQAMAGPA